MAIDTHSTKLTAMPEQKTLKTSHHLMEPRNMFTPVIYFLFHLLLLLILLFLFRAN